MTQKLHKFLLLLLAQSIEIHRRSQGTPKITKLPNFVNSDNVLGFDVEVDDSDGMEFLQWFGDILQDIEYLRLFEISAIELVKEGFLT